MTLTVLLLPPPPDCCPICATKHTDQEPHNAQSLYYQQRFNAARGRWPTWADAIAHCDAKTRAMWKRELLRIGEWTAPVDAGDVIADPPGESFSQMVEIPRCEQNG